MPPPPGLSEGPSLDAHRWPAWHRDAACREHPEVTWFPELGESTAPAKAVCHTCLVQEECLAWALAQEPTLAGVWGGTSAIERRRMLRARRSGPE